MARRILRWNVPVDDEWHRIDAQRIVHVGTRGEDYAEVWTEVIGERASWLWLRVFGTGQPVEGDYVGTAITPTGAFVWHVYARRA